MLTQLLVQTEASSAVAPHLNAHDSADIGHLQAEAVAAAQKDGASSCCIGCFRLMPPPPGSLPDGSDDSTDSPEPELLCASCILRLAGKTNTSPAVQLGGGVLSPLPKLSLLVKAEAKCQDQMQLLRSQQEILKQQRESLQAAKHAKEEALAAERELARQRRKHFLMIQERRKREEELKLQQFQVEEHTSRSEQEGNGGKSKKKPKPPKVDMSLQRRTSDPAAEINASDASWPHLATPMSKHDGAPLSNATTTNEDHTTSLYERRRQMTACYSQDLSPLIDGRKPRRLPSPKPVAAIAPSRMIKRRQAPDNDAQITAVATTHRNKNQQKGHSPAPKVMKLRPLEEEKRYSKTRPHQSNQFEDFHARGNNEALRKLSLQSPHALVGHPAPLTAEIKPVSWANEILPQDDSTDEVGSLVLSTPLHSVAEEPNDGTQFTMFPLQRQLPTPTFPPSKPGPQVDVASKVPRWEYSAERLSSLLEKYNVSVSAVTTATCAPKL
ncbi:hypothetical protein PC121_g10030 [Phytophthora cactorum]|nr:hypothetical protein PC121_g10030 [Phytophthora cactorum]KAG4059465.1 hypothetical protein PC123_g5615 [Phytophthora cactorum]